MNIAKEEELYPIDAVRESVLSLPHHQELGIRVVELRRGFCVAQLVPSPRYAGGGESDEAHGGVIAPILDCATGMAALSVVEGGQTVATLDLRIDHLRRPGPGPRPIFGRAECYRLARSVAFVRGEVYWDDQVSVAQFAATFMVGSVGFSLQ